MLPPLVDCRLVGQNQSGLSRLDDFLRSAGFSPYPQRTLKGYRKMFLSGGISLKTICLLSAIMLHFLNVKNSIHFKFFWF